MKTVGVLSTRKLGNGALGGSPGGPVCVEAAGWNVTLVCTKLYFVPGNASHCSTYCTFFKIFYLLKNKALQDQHNLSAHPIMMDMFNSSRCSICVFVCDQELLRDYWYTVFGPVKYNIVLQSVIFGVCVNGVNLFCIIKSVICRNFFLSFFSLLSGGWYSVSSCTATLMVCNRLYIKCGCLWNGIWPLSKG